MSPEVLEHFQRPRNVGELDPPAITAEVTNPVCGDILRVSVLLKEDVIAQVRYKVRGCAASIAAGSALTELMDGKSVKDLTAISAADIEQALGGLSNESKHAAVLGVDVLRILAAKLAQNSLA